MATAKAPPKKPGPQPRPDSEKRSVVLQVRLMPRELETLKEAAKVKEADISSWVRELALKSAERILAKEG